MCQFFLDSFVFPLTVQFRFCRAEAVFLLYVFVCLSVREKWGNESIGLRHSKSKLKFLATEGDDRYSVHLCALTDQTKQDRNESVSSASR